MLEFGVRSESARTGAGRSPGRPKPRLVLWGLCDECKETSHSAHTTFGACADGARLSVNMTDMPR